MEGQGGRAKGGPPAGSCPAQEVTPAVSLGNPRPGRGAPPSVPEGGDGRQRGRGAPDRAQTHRTGQRAGLGPLTDRVGTRRWPRGPLPLPSAPSRGLCAWGGQEAHPAPPTAQPPPHLPHQARTPGTSQALGQPQMGKLRHLSLQAPSLGLLLPNK